MNIICTKCNHVLDLEVEPDTGECPKCDGHTYQEGDIFENHLTHSQQNAVDLLASIQASRNVKKLLN
jgi:phage FluMu protein Com